MFNKNKKRYEQLKKKYKNLEEALLKSQRDLSAMNEYNVVLYKENKKLAADCEYFQNHNEQLRSRIGGKW